MGHRPYPNLERARRYVDSRHGSSCPRCGHWASVHPFQDGQFVCSRTLNGLPSCRECAARWSQLRITIPDGATVRAPLLRIHVAPPSADAVTEVGRSFQRALRRGMRSA